MGKSCAVQSKPGEAEDEGAPSAVAATEHGQSKALIVALAARGLLVAMAPRWMRSSRWAGGGAIRPSAMLWMMRTVGLAADGLAVNGEAVEGGPSNWPSNWPSNALGVSIADDGGSAPRAGLQASETTLDGSFGPSIGSRGTSKTA